MVESFSAFGLFFITAVAMAFLSLSIGLLNAGSRSY